MRDDVLSGQLASALASKMARRETPSQEAHKFKVHNVAADGKTCTIEVGGKTVTADTGVTVAPADIVQATWKDGRFTVISNLTNPAVVSDGEYAVVKDVAAEANALLGKITGAADEADMSVSAIMDDMVAAGRGVDQIKAYVGYSEEAAQTLAERVEEVDRSAKQGISDIADDVAAVEEATNTALGEIRTSVQDAADAASEADRKAEAAGRSATRAQQQAEAATSHANSALVQLAAAQDVIGVVNWITEHGTYSLTGDGEVDASKVYYERTGSGTKADPYVYAAVAEPSADGLASYYELSIDQALSQFVASHLALTDAGLYVLKDESSWKTLMRSDGWEVQDPAGAAALSVGASGLDFDGSRSWHMGSQDAYILYTPASGGAPAKLVIGGEGIQLGSSKTLAQWEAQVEEASRAAMDGAHLSITSTNGNLFKNGSESTVLQAAVFPNGGDRLDTIEQVRSRFGAGARVEWRWMHESDGEWGTLLSSDPHLGNGGMWLTVTPEDVASKTTFSASLVVPD